MVVVNSSRLVTAAVYNSGGGGGEKKKRVWEREHPGVNPPRKGFTSILRSGLDFENLIESAQKGKAKNFINY